VCDLVQIRSPAGPTDPARRATVVRAHMRL
jgi:hypothetical protein